MYMERQLFPGLTRSSGQEVEEEVDGSRTDPTGSADSTVVANSDSSGASCTAPPAATAGATTALSGCAMKESKFSSWALDIRGIRVAEERVDGTSVVAAAGFAEVVPLFVSLSP